MEGARFVPIESRAFPAALVRGNSADAQVEFALRWLETWLNFKQSCDETGTVIFDIDDTLITYQDKAKRPKRLPAASLYQKCAGKFHRIIITARPDVDNNREETARVLEDLDIRDWDALEMMPYKDFEMIRTNSPETMNEIIAKFKWSRRDEIAKTSPIIANVGNAWTDLVRFPLTPDLRFIWTASEQIPCVFFPPHSHDEVAVKVPMTGW